MPVRLTIHSTTLVVCVFSPNACTFCTCAESPHSLEAVWNGIWVWSWSTPGSGWTYTQNQVEPGMASSVQLLGEMSIALFQPF